VLFQNAQGSESVKHGSERIALSNTAAADDVNETVRDIIMDIYNNNV
jgi:hypothetical protein